MASNEIKMQSSRNMKAKTKGNNTVQQKDISWSNLILGKLARTHIKPKANTQVLNPNEIPYKAPSIIGRFKSWMIDAPGYK
jgi:hypothetical protein